MTVACDGQRTFRVFEDEVRAGPASTLDQGWHGYLAQLVDGSWLLGCRLSGGEAVEVDGRTGYRVIATIGAGPVTGGGAVVAAGLVAARRGGCRCVVRPAAAADAVLRRQGGDAAGAEVGVGRRAGRLRVHAAGRAAVVEERERDRSGGSDDDDGDLKFFGPDGRPASPPDEVRAVADAFKQQVDEKVAAARGFLGSFFGDRWFAGSWA